MHVNDMSERLTFLFLDSALTPTSLELTRYPVGLSLLVFCVLFKERNERLSSNFFFSGLRGRGEGGCTGENRLGGRGDRVHF